MWTQSCRSLTAHTIFSVILLDVCRIGESIAVLTPRRLVLVVVKVYFAQSWLIWGVVDGGWRAVGCDTCGAVHIDNTILLVAVHRRALPGHTPHSPHQLTGTNKTATMTVSSVDTVWQEHAAGV